MKNKCFLFIMLFVPFLSRAERIYSSVEKDIPFIAYSIVGQESMQELANRFYISVAELAVFNHLKPDAILETGKALKVPVKQILKPICANDCVEVFYRVQPAEGLYRVGKNFGYPNSTVLKKLNKLKSDKLSKGQLLRVGYISKEVFAAKAEGQHDDPVMATDVEIPEKSNQPAFKSIGEKKETVDSSNLIDMHYTGEGFFKPEYKAGRQQGELTGSTFKTETGWRDGKFYVLVDKLAIGKVIKLRNSLTGAVIYAKVLGQLPHISKNDIVKIRLSSASAIALGFSEDQLFTVELSY